MTDDNLSSDRDGASRIAPTVVVANLDDALHCSAVVAVLDTYASDPVGGGRPLSPDVRARLVPMLRDTGHALVLLAFDGGRPVGLAIGFFGLSTFAARRLLNIHDLCVVPGRRGRGIGEALLLEAERLAIAHGCCKLTLEVQDDNLRARRLYQRFGFGDLLFGDSGPTRFLVKCFTPLTAADHPRARATRPASAPACCGSRRPGVGSDAPDWRHL